MANKKGRPSIAINGSVCASTMLPVETYDGICRKASAHNESVSAAIRNEIASGQELGEMSSEIRRRYGRLILRGWMFAELAGHIAQAIRAGRASEKDAENLELFAKCAGPIPSPAKQDEFAQVVFSECRH